MIILNIQTILFLVPLNTNCILSVLAFLVFSSNYLNFFHPAHWYPGISEPAKCSYYPTLCCFLVDKVIFTSVIRCMLFSYGASSSLELPWRDAAARRICACYLGKRT